MPKIDGLKWTIRYTTEKDIPIIMDLCHQLSIYEKLEFKGTKELYKKYGFSKDKITPYGTFSTRTRASYPGSLG